MNLENNPIVMSARLLVFLLCSFGNAFLIFFILRSKHLRRENFNILLVQLGVSDILLGIGNGLRGIQFLLVDSSQAQTNLQCALLGIPIVTGSYLSEINMFLMAVDRFICVALPVVFRNYMTQKSFAIGRFVSAMAVAFFFSGMQFIGMDADQNPPVCNALYTWQPAYKNFYLFGTSAIDLISLCCYAILLFIIRANKTNASGKQRQFYFVVFFVVVAFIVFWMIPKLTFLVHLLLNSTSISMQLSAMLVGFLEGVNGIANVVIFISTNNDAKVKVLRRKTISVVSPVSMAFKTIALHSHASFIQ